MHLHCNASASVGPVAEQEWLPARLAVLGFEAEGVCRGNQAAHGFGFEFDSWAVMVAPANQMMSSLT